MSDRDFLGLRRFARYISGATNRPIVLAVVAMNLLAFALWKVPCNCESGTIAEPVVVEVPSGARFQIPLAQIVRQMKESQGGIRED